MRGQALGSVHVAGEQSPLAAAFELVEPGAGAGAKSGNLVNRQVMAVGAERDDLSEPGPRQNRQRLAGSGFPDPHGIVLAGGSNPVAIGAEGQIRHKFVVPVERDAFLAASDIPEPRRVVPGCAGQGVAVGTERKRRDRAAMSPECHRRSLGFDQSDLDRIVRTTMSQPPAVWTHCKDPEIDPGPGDCSHDTDAGIVDLDAAVIPPDGKATARAINFQPGRLGLTAVDRRTTRRPAGGVEEFDAMAPGNPAQGAVGQEPNLGDRVVDGWPVPGPRSGRPDPRRTRDAACA